MDPWINTKAPKQPPTGLCPKCKVNQAQMWVMGLARCSACLWKARLKQVYQEQKDAADAEKNRQ